MSSPTPDDILKMHQERSFGSAVTDMHASVAHKGQSNQPLRPIPAPTGPSPYHLSLDSILPAELMAQIRASGRIVFHIAGDTGGVRSPQPQQLVAMKMEEQFNLPNPADRPAFFYILGDVVYYYGELDQYYPQFYEPYSHYPAPIFAIPGNHDADVLRDSGPSLAGFVENLCAASPYLTNQAGDVPRDAMTQPNVYWTLEAPFVTIVGLYTNVPEGGKVDDEQYAWFVNELATAPRDKALIVAAHHVPYSMDAHHGGSSYLKKLLEQAILTSGRLPDMVIGGHIHNYQRFTRRVDNTEIPYVVVGCGGYWHLHYMAHMTDGKEIAVPYAVPHSDVTLESYQDRRHGFVRLVVGARGMAGEYFTVPRPQESWRAPAERGDAFAVDIVGRKMVK
jgi:hypothetical protein